MKIKIAEIHFKDLNIEKYALKKVGRLAKYNHWVQKINIRLTSKKNRAGKNNDFFCELEFDIAGKNFVIKDREKDIDKAIDKAVERAKRTLIKHKEKEVSKKYKAAIKVKGLKRG